MEKHRRQNVEPRIQTVFSLKENASQNDKEVQQKAHTLHHQH